MSQNKKIIVGNWNSGYALDKHIISSTYVGDNQYGRPTFDTKRTEIGEALYQLKYKNDQSQIEFLSNCVVSCAKSNFNYLGLIIPMPSSTPRATQPVTLLARAVGAKMNIPVFEELLFKKKNGKHLKDIATKDEKIKALENTMSLTDQINGDGKWNALLIDDLYDTGATLEEACKLLNGYKKINNIYTVTLTWK